MRTHHWHHARARGASPRAYVIDTTARARGCEPSAHATSIAAQVDVCKGGSLDGDKVSAKEDNGWETLGGE